MPELGVQLTGHKKSIDDGVGAGGGYVAYQPQHDGSVFDSRRKHVDLSGVSAFCGQQTQVS